MSTLTALLVSMRKGYFTVLKLKKKAIFFPKTRFSLSKFTKVIYEHHTVNNLSNAMCIEN